MARNVMSNQACSCHIIARINELTRNENEQYEILVSDGIK